MAGGSGRRRRVKRGEVWWAKCATRRRRRRWQLVVIASNDASNRFLPRVQVVPLTSDVDRVYPGEAQVAVRKRRQKAMPDQVTTIPASRLARRAGELSREDMAGVDEGIRLQLGLAP